MNTMKKNVLNFCLVVFVLISIVSIYFTFTQIFKYQFPIENLLGAKISNSKNEVANELENRNNRVTITIDNNEIQTFDNVKTIYLETRKVNEKDQIEIETTILSPKKLMSYKEFLIQEYKTNNGKDELRDYSLQNLMLQTATGSGDAHARGGCCIGPITNSDGSVTPRQCSASFCN